MSNLNLDRIRKKLEAERAALEAQIARHTDAVGPDGDRLGESTDFDSNHPGDMGTDTVERAREAAMAGNLAALVAEINGALTKIGDGTYGTCSRCGRSIAPERLKHIPSATLCIDCQTRIENTP